MSAPTCALEQVSITGTLRVSFAYYTILTILDYTTQYYTVRYYTILYYTIRAPTCALERGSIAGTPRASFART